LIDQQKYIKTKEYTKILRFRKHKKMKEGTKPDIGMAFESGAKRSQEIASEEPIFPLLCCFSFFYYFLRRIFWGFSLSCHFWVWRIRICASSSSPYL
jgi:hypothetical protein